MLTSPAWLTRRSSSGARTRTADCVASVRSTGLTAPLPLAREARPVDRRRLGRGTAASGAGAVARRAATAALARSVVDLVAPSSARRRPRRCRGGGRNDRRRDEHRRVGRSARAPARSARATGATGAVAAATASEYACASRLRSASKALRHRVGDGLQRLDVLGARRGASVAVSRSIRVSSRCAISPRRIAPARRAPPFSVCSVRMHADGVRVVRGLAQPVAQLAVELGQQLLRFFLEDREQLEIDRVDGVDLVVDLAERRRARLRRTRLPRPAPRRAASARRRRGC